jgi:hypothetical protein
MIASEPGMDAVNLLEPVDEQGGRLRGFRWRFKVV